MTIGRALLDRIKRWRRSKRDDRETATCTMCGHVSTTFEDTLAHLWMHHMMGDV